MSATPSSNLGFQNFFSGLLTGDITSSSVDILMDTIPNASEGFLVIDPLSTTAREVIFYTSKTALKVVCPSAADGRGQDDTTAGAHLTGTTVIMAPVAGFWEAFQSGLAFTDGVINTSKLNGASEFIFDFVASGLVLSGDAYGSTRAYSLTSGVVYIGGKRVAVSAVSAQTVTASKDRYIDVDNTGALTNTEVNNNAASPALAAGSIRLGVVVAGASNIANVGSVNQGQEDKVLPIASSIAYSVTDSLGNLICPRDPHRKVLGYRQSLTTTAASASAHTQLTGISCPVIIPTGRKAKISLVIPRATQTAGSIRTVQGAIWDGVVVSGTMIGQQQESHDSANILYNNFHVMALYTSSGSKTFNGAGATDSGTENFVGSAGAPIFIIVELV